MAKVAESDSIQNNSLMEISPNPSIDNTSQAEQLETLFLLAKTTLKEFDSLTIPQSWPSITSSHKLKSYAFYKQATRGVCVDTLKVDDKWITWKRLGNMSKERAKISYIKLAVEILTLYESFSVEQVGEGLDAMGIRKSGKEWRFWESMGSKLEELKKVENFVSFEDSLDKQKKSKSFFGRMVAKLQSGYFPQYFAAILALAILLKFQSLIRLVQRAIK